MRNSIKFYVTISLEAISLLRKNPRLFFPGFFLTLSPLFLALFFLYFETGFYWFTKFGFTQTKLYLLENTSFFGMLFQIVLLVSLFLLIIVSNIFLARSVYKVKKKEIRVSSFRGIFSLKPITRLIGLAFIFLLALSFATISFLVPALLMLATQSFFANGLFFLISALCLVPILAVFIFSRLFAQFYIILASLPILSSIKAGYLLFQSNIKTSLYFSLFLILSNILALFISFAVSLLFFFLIGLFGVFMGNETFGVSFGTTLLFVIVFLAKMLISTYNHTAWTIYFMTIAHQKDILNEKSSSETVLNTSLSLLPKNNRVFQEPGCGNG